MTQLFAFSVAVPETSSPSLGAYDPEREEFVWEGDSQITLGSPLCTRNSGYNGYSNCSATSTQCYFSGIKCTPLECNHAYFCDYG